MIFRRFRQARAQALRAAQGGDQLKAAQEAWAKLIARVSQLEIALRDLEMQHSTTVSHLNKLRGQVHGGRAHLRSVDSLDAIPIGDKASLRARAGLLAGQPAPHQE